MIAWGRAGGGGGGEGGTSIYGLYMYVPQDIFFVPLNNVFPALSLDRIPKLCQLKLQCKNA